MLIDFTKLASEVGEALKKKNWQVVTAESCTGGWVAQTLTSVPGASAFFDCGFVTYSNESKQKLLGVRADTLEQYGAVSEQTVREMAEGALARSHAEVSVAITGLAGPGGGSAEKPIGTVWFGLAGKNLPTKTICKHFVDGRENIRRQAVYFALEILGAIILKTAVYPRLIAQHLELSGHIKI